MTIVSDIENAYKIKLPEMYVNLLDAGAFVLPDKDRGTNLLNSTYLMLNDMEWINPTEILDWDCPEEVKSNYCPFAFNGAGENWCFNPLEIVDDYPAIVLCDNIGEAHWVSPSFDGALLDQVLGFAVDYPEDPEVNEQYLDRYKKTFNFPIHWWDIVGKIISGEILVDPREGHVPILRELLSYEKAWGYFTWDTQQNNS